MVLAVVTARVVVVALPLLAVAELGRAGPLAIALPLAAVRAWPLANSPEEGRIKPYLMVYIFTLFIENGRGTKEISSVISPLQFCL